MVVNSNQHVFIIDVNTKPGLHYEYLDDSYLVIACLQRVFRTIYKLKYNKKYKINKNINNYLEKIFKLY